MPERGVGHDRLLRCGASVTHMAMRRSNLSKVSLERNLPRKTLRRTIVKNCSILVVLIKHKTEKTFLPILFFQVGLLPLTANLFNGCHVGFFQNSVKFFETLQNDSLLPCGRGLAQKTSKSQFSQLCQPLVKKTTHYNEHTTSTLPRNRSLGTTTESRSLDRHHIGRICTPKLPLPALRE